MKNFFLGFLAGIGNITPGISGSVLLIIFNLYEKIINSIANIFKNFKKNFLFLLPISIGIILGTFLFSNIIEYSLNTFPLITSIVFVGFLMGTLPSLFIKANIKGFKFNYLIFFLITFTLGSLFLFFKDITISNNINDNFFILILLGFIIASSTIIPGISSTVILTILGLYKTYLSAINGINIKLLIPIFIGLVIGIFLLSKLINYLLNKFYSETFYSIIGFTIATIPGLIPNINNIKDLIIGIILAIIAFILTVFLTNKKGNYN